MEVEETEAGLEERVGIDFFFVSAVNTCIVYKKM